MSFARPPRPPHPLATMLSLRRYRLFISHAWDYTGEYEAAVNLLNTDFFFQWDNLSVPEETPLMTLPLLPRSYRYLVRQIDERILQADCLLVLAGMYVAHSGWIQSEMEAAREFRKPIIAVRPRGNERFPEAAMLIANETVWWNTASIVSAIRRNVSDAPAPPIPPSRLRGPFG